MCESPLCYDPELHHSEFEPSLDKQDQGGRSHLPICQPTKQAVLYGRGGIGVDGGWD